MPIKAEPVSWGYSHKNDFPLKVFYKDHQARILFTANISHNSRWLHHLRDGDRVVAMLAWSFEPELLAKEKDFLTSHRHNLEHWYILCNTQAQVATCAKLGLRGYFVNQNCFLDESLFRIHSGVVPKRYGAIYNARLAGFKRHSLAKLIPDLALIVGHHHAEADDIRLDTVPHIYHNHRPLDPAEVCQKLQEAYCGIVLSAAEGACYSSSEYLLSGLPVVSTPSTGGRDVWYDASNSLVCEAAPEAIQSAVATMGRRFGSGEIDPLGIRNRHIRTAWSHRMNFVDLLGLIFREAKIGTDPYLYFRRNFSHKMIEEYVPLAVALIRLEVCESQSQRHPA